MPRIDLGVDKAGQPAWADVIEPDEMTARQRRLLQEKYPVSVGADGKTQMTITAGTVAMMRAEVITAATSDWSYPCEITTDTVEDLPVKTFDLLADATETHWGLVNFSRPETAGESSSE